MTQNNGGPAFPSDFIVGNSGIVAHKPYSGMTLRDWFAGQALCGLMSNCDDNGTNSWFVDGAVKHAYEMANAMIAAHDIHGYKK